MFRVNPRVTLGLVFFTVLIQKSEKQWKVLRDRLTNLPMGIPLGHQTFPQGCAPRESLMTLRNSLGQIFPDNPCGLSTVCPTCRGHISGCQSDCTQERNCRNDVEEMDRGEEGTMDGQSQGTRLGQEWEMPLPVLKPNVRLRFEA